MTISFTNKFPIRGLEPQPDNKGMVNTDAWYNIDSSAYTGRVPLFVGSPYILVAGKIRAAGTATPAGSITAIRDSNGKYIQNIATLTDGTCEVTTDPDQHFIATISTADFTGQAMYNYYADLTTETGTAYADGRTGGFSTVQIDGSTLNVSPSGLSVKILKMTGAANNAASVIGTQVICRPVISADA